MRPWTTARGRALLSVPMARAAHNGGASLRRRDWLTMHPIEKWTTLVDLGRRAPFLLEPPQPVKEGTIPGTTQTTIRTGKLGDDEAARFTCDAVARHRSLSTALPYCVRLRLSLSFLMWVRSLRDVQDTIARLQLPYAPTRRLRGDSRRLVADVYPTRLAEWIVDPFTTVAVAMDAGVNSSGEQVPAPHAWDPETEYDEDKNTMKRHRGEKCLGRNELRAVQGMRPRPSDDDDKVPRMSGRRLRRALTSSSALTSVSSSSHSSPHSCSCSSSPSSRSSASWAVSDAQRSAMPSPLSVDYAADEQYHRDDSRGEGCPLDDKGQLFTTPVHINTLSEKTKDPNAVAQYCAMAHAAVLSSLFVEGRTVRFTTNHPLVLEYIAFLFDELIEDRWMSVALVGDNAEGLRSYVPDWATRSVFVVMPPKGSDFTPHQRKDIAGLILQSAPCSVLIEGNAHQRDHYTVKLQDEVARLRRQTDSDASRESYWRISWVPLRRADAVSGAASHTGMPQTEFQLDVNEVLRHFYSASFLYVPSNCAFSPREAQNWWWDGLPSNVHVVGVNSHALDILFYFPQAPFLPKRVGGAYRYRAVRRVVFGKNVYGDSSAESRFRRWAHWCCRWRGLSSMGLHSPIALQDRARVLSGWDAKEKDEEAVHALRWERTVDFLANPSKLTCLALLLGGDKEETEEKKNCVSCELLSCPRCSELLYCSEACAEIGWYCHRSFCSGVPPPVCIAISKSQHAELEQTLMSLLQTLAEETDNKDVDFCHLLCSLEEIQPLDELSNETKSLLSKVVDSIGRTAASATTTERTLPILLQAKIMSAFLGDCDGALATLRQGLAWLLSNDSLEGAANCTFLLHTERMNVWTRKYPNVILAPNAESSPLSSRIVACGELVAKDLVPLLAWSGCGFPPVLLPRQSSTYDDTLRAMRDAFLEACAEKNDKEGLSDRDLSIVLGEFPALREADAEAIVAIESYLWAIRKDTNISVPCWLSNLFAMALLSSRSCGTNRWGFFDLASRVRHSCAPNCVWDAATGTLRAVRSIAVHESLTLTAFWGPPSNDKHQLILKLPAHMRRESVRGMIGISCVCERCVGRSFDKVPCVDKLRGFPCPLCTGDNGWRYRYLQDATPSTIKQGGQSVLHSSEKLMSEKQLALQRRLEPWEPWVCVRCGEHWGDTDMPLTKEAQLCQQGERLVVMARRGAIGRGYFEEVKALMQDTLQVMGREHHSAYLLACEAIVLFYRYVSCRFAQPTDLVAQNHVVMWCRKWIRCAMSTELVQDCPHIYDSFLVETALSLTNVTLFREKIIILRHAESQCPIVAVYGSNDHRVTAVASVLHDPKSPDFTLMARGPSAFSAFMNAEEQDGIEDALIAAWEAHLMDRVHSEIQGNERPRLPRHLAQALQRTQIN